MAAIDATPYGPAFRIDVNRLPVHWGAPVVAATDDGFVALWSQGKPDSAGHDLDLVARRFTREGAAVGEEYTVGSLPHGNRDWEPYPVSVNSAGDFIIVWRSYPGGDRSSGVVSGMRFNRNGVPAGVPFPVATSFGAVGGHMDVTLRDDGSFVVVWDQLERADPGSGASDRTVLLGQRFGRDGQPVGRTFPVSERDTHRSSYPTVASDGQGGFVVAWSVREHGGTVVVARGFTSVGTPREAVHRIDVHSAADGPGWGDIAFTTGGRYLLIWCDQTDLSAYQIDQTGQPIGQRRNVAGNAPPCWMRPAITRVKGGALMAAWIVRHDDTNFSGSELRTRPLRLDGTPAGPWFALGRYAIPVRSPVLAATASGEVMVAWPSFDNPHHEPWAMARVYKPHLGSPGRQGSARSLQ